MPAFGRSYSLPDWAIIVLANAPTLPKMVGLRAARGPSGSKKMRATRTLILTKASSLPTRFLALNINRKRFNQMAG